MFRVITFLKDYSMKPINQSKVLNRKSITSAAFRIIPIYYVTPLKKLKMILRH